MSSTSTPVKRACDSCHRRKVRCIGEGTNPCKNCISASLTCTYNAIPQKKGPKGSRAKVLSELRETQRQSQVGSGYPHDLGYDSRSLSSPFARSPGLLPPGLVESCVEFFFGNLYPSQPILHRQRIRDTIMGMEHSVEAYCMIVALCAYVMVQSNMSVPPNVVLHGETSQISNISLGVMLLEESVRVRRGYDYIENPSLLTVITSFFFFGSYFCLDKDNSAWFYLREATTHAQLMGMHDEETYKAGDSIDCSTRRRLYWVLFVAERTYALHKHRSVTLHATINLPTVEEDPSERIQISGFIQLANLFKPFDDNFIGLWNKVRTNCNPSWLAQLQSQLSEALPTYLESTEIQAADLKITQHWLRTMVWQLCVSHGFVSSMATDNAMTFKYPIEISRDLLSMMRQFSQQAMEVHGVGLIEKLFDIACCLTDVIACIPFSPSTFSLGPQDYLFRFLTHLSSLRSGHTRYLPLLLSKINDVLPNLSLPPLPPPPNSGLIATSSISPSPSLSHSVSGTDPALLRQLQSHTQSQSQPQQSASASLIPPSSRVEDLSLYDSAHSTSAPSSHEATPGPYEQDTTTHHAQVGLGYGIQPTMGYAFGAAVSAGMGFPGQEAQAPVQGQGMYERARGGSRFSG